MCLYELLPQILGEHIAAYLFHFGKILIASSDVLNGLWSFEIMIDRNPFVSIPNCLDADVKILLVIVTSRRPRYLTYGETGNLSSSGTEIKSAGFLYLTEPNPRLVKYVFPVLPLMRMSSIRSGMVKPSFVSILWPPFLEKSLWTACVVVVK